MQLAGDVMVAAKIASLFRMPGAGAADDDSANGQ